jgi:hypothetical protein
MQSRHAAGRAMTGTGDRPAAKDDPRGLDALVMALAAEFPDYFIGTQATWNGLSLSAHHKERAAEPGVYAVITSDPDEMRRALCDRLRRA